ncbi:uncharacterized protein LOC112554391 [Pomacea canaliculata]|uniref:uncharacterized protein LOC112554391 n=1 Tax=Pomacea canaliculata TaxID=400727 RepID=UPI000D733ADC|nr:uncharacterized protein LOC112554391 [Pomacea canaliculata]
MGVIAALENMALNKPAQQSSESLLYSGIAKKAVDGNTDGNFLHGSCTHTDESYLANKPWWKVDLMGFYKVSGVEIFTRTDCCSYRLKQFEVRVSLVNPTTFPSNEGQQCFYRTDEVPTSGLYINCTQPIIGRYVSLFKPNLYVLSICELRVFADRAGAYSGFLDNFRAVGKANKSFEGVSASTCAVRCAQTDSCFVFNFRRSTAASKPSVTCEVLLGLSAFVPFNESNLIAQNGSRLKQFEVRVSLVNPTTFPSNEGQQCFYRTDEVPTSGLYINCTQPIIGRYVSLFKPNLDVLSICELRVFADRAALENVALNKPAQHVSEYQYSYAPAGKAVDGNTDGNFYHGFCSHTKVEVQSTTWWKVDLMGFFKVTSIQIFTRTDCCDFRLQKFEVRVSLTNPVKFPSSEGQQCFYRTDQVPTSGLYVNCTQPIIGRYVSLYKATLDALTLCELRVFADKAGMTMSLVISCVQHGKETLQSNRMILVHF